MIVISMDTRQLERALTQIGREQLPFSAAQAINNTLKDLQLEEQRDLRNAFVLRRPDWAMRSVKIVQFANKRTLSGTLAISPPGAPDRAGILAQHEQGRSGLKTPKDGRSVAIPVNVRRNKRDIVTKANRPRAMIEKGKAKGKVFVVRQGDRSHLPEGVYRRGGSAKRPKLTMMYALELRVRLPRTLRFYAIARKVVPERLARQFELALVAALKTARPK